MHMRLTKAIETKTKWLNIHLSPLFDYSDTLWQLMIIIFCLSLRNILKSKVGSCIWILFGKCFLQKLASALKNFFFCIKVFIDHIDLSFKVIWAYTRLQHFSCSVCFSWSIRDCSTLEKQVRWNWFVCSSAEMSKRREHSQSNCNFDPLTRKKTTSRAEKDKIHFFNLKTHFTLLVLCF